MRSIAAVAPQYREDLDMVNTRTDMRDIREKDNIPATSKNIACNKYQSVILRSKEDANFIPFIRNNTIRAYY